MRKCSSINHLAMYLHPRREPQPPQLKADAGAGPTCHNGAKHTWQKWLLEARGWVWPHGGENIYKRMNLLISAVLPPSSSIRLIPARPGLMDLRHLVWIELWTKSTGELLLSLLGGVGCTLQDLKLEAAEQWSFQRLLPKRTNRRDDNVLANLLYTSKLKSYL